MTKSKTLQKIDVFISSPGDVQKERQIAKRIISRLNRMQHIASRYILKPLAYEEEVPAAIGKPPQMTVDHYMMQASKSDLFICILWHRMGTPVTDEETGEQFQSGTEYEFVSAYRANQQHGKPHILLYRGIKPIPHDSDLEQVKQVQAFFKRFEGDKLEYKGLYKTYRTDAQFEELLFHDLDTLLSKELSFVSGEDSVSYRTTTSVDLEHHEKEQRLKAMLADHSGFMRDRLSSFVGRVRELEEIQQRINTLVSTGGYLTITGQAGQGKSSMIAKLVQEYSPDITAHHFIPFTPGPDYQVSLLRDVMARLILKYDLSDLHVASVNRTALRDAFPKVLKEVVTRSGQELIFIDGLDQLEADSNGERDLSFLPNNPPQGVVFVLGTRPDDTLRPLELRKPRFEYCLPDLSREDFVLLLEHRGVKLNQSLIDQFYGAMQKNALYLDLVAKELAQEGAAQPEEIIKRVADNPDDIFTLSIERLQRKPNDVEWREVLKPILGVLLVAREPLTARHLRQILEVRHIPGIDDHRLRKGLMRLGGLVADDGRHRYLLFHLKLYNYLLQDESNPQKNHIFATDEEQGWHKTLADWCEMSNLATIWEDIKRDAIEQGRREYARQNYITHLYLAREWQKLFAVLDEGAYGQAKIRYDLSTRSFAQDLYRGRQAAAWEEWTLEEAVAVLPCLWRYSLLQCNLAGRADKYSLEMFEALVALKRERDALGLVELLTNQCYKVTALVRIAGQVAKQPDGEQESVPILIRACEVAQGIEEKEEDRIKALGELSRALAHIQQWERAEAIAHGIDDEFEKAAALSELSKTLAHAQQWEHAEAIARTIENSWYKDKALSELSKTLAYAQQWGKAEAIMYNIQEQRWKAKALQEMGMAFAQNQQWKKAETIWTKAEIIVRSVEDNRWKAEALRELGTILAQAQRWQWAMKVWNEAKTFARFIRVSWERAQQLRELGVALAQAQRGKEAIEVLDEVKTNILFIGVSRERTRELRELGDAFVQAQQLEKAIEVWAEAETTAHTIDSRSEKAKALNELSKTLANTQQWKRAEMVALSIEETWQKSEALGELSKVLAYARQWQQAEMVWAKAEELTRSIESTRDRAEVLRDLSKALAHSGQWEQAEAIIVSIELEKEQAEALGELSKALAYAQQWEQARAIAFAIEETSLKIEALIELKTTLIHAQQRKYIEVVEREIANTMDSLKHGKKSAKTLLELSKALIQAQQWEYARIVWEELESLWDINDLEKRIPRLTELSKLLIQAHQWDWAEAVALDIALSEQGLEILQTLSEALVQAQEWKRAEKLLTEAEKLFGGYFYSGLHRETDTGRERILTLLELGVVLLKSRQKNRAAAVWAKAEKVAYLIEPGVERSAVLSELSLGLTQVQQWDRAEAVARSIDHDEEKDEALSELSRALTQAKLWKKAEVVARSIGPGNGRAKAMRELWTALAKASQSEEAEKMWIKAEEIAHTIGEYWERSEALYELVSSIVQMQQWERAEAVVHSMEENYYKAKALQNLSSGLAHVQQWGQAEKVVRSIESEEERAVALGDFGMMLAQAKMWKKAEMVWIEAIEVARTIENDWNRAKTLQELTKVLIQSQRWEQAEIAARCIDIKKIKTEALRNIWTILAQMSQWERAETVVSAFEEECEKAEALRDLAKMLAEAGKYEQLSHLIQRSWLKANTVAYAIKLLPMANGLIPLKSEIGPAFCESFTWVDKFLKG